MDWYYQSGSSMVGPCSAEEMRAQYDAATINESTLVQNDSMSQLMPLGEAIRMGLANELGIMAMVGCPTCGSAVNQSDLIPMGNNTLCPNCRNQYLQSMREGVPISNSEYEFAGFGIRLGGWFLDWIIMFIYSMLLQLSFGMGMMGMNQAGADNLSIAAFVIYLILSYAVPFVYVVYFLGSPKFQATPGMMAVKIRIITTDGGDCSYLRAVGRYFAAILSALILLIGYFMALWDPERQTLHDKICSTFVIKKN